MVRISLVASALLFAASSLTLSYATLEYTIRVRNLTYMQPFSPIVMVAHTKDIYFWREAESAMTESGFFKRLTENGDPPDIGLLAERAGVAEYICGYTVYPGSLMPGETERITLTVNEDICEGGGVISMTSKLSNTNDGFVGIDSEKLKTDGSDKYFPPAWDAGSEDNNELCTHMPGPACADTEGNLEAGPGEGYVHVHRGVRGIGDLPSADYTWLNPAAEIYIAKPTQG